MSNSGSVHLRQKLWVNVTASQSVILAACGAHNVTCNERLRAQMHFLKSTEKQVNIHTIIYTEWVPLTAKVQTLPSLWKEMHWCTVLGGCFKDWHSHHLWIRPNKTQPASETSAKSSADFCRSVRMKFKSWVSSQPPFKKTIKIKKHSILCIFN